MNFVTLWLTFSETLTCKYSGGGQKSAKLVCTLPGSAVPPHSNNHTRSRNNNLPLISKIIMGCCFNRGNEDDEVSLQLNDVVSDSVTCKCGNKGDKVEITREIGKNTFIVSGHGTVVGSCPLDGDTSTWQVRVGKVPADCKVGIKRWNKKKNIPLNGLLDDVGASQDNESWFLKDVVLKEGDVVGIYWDQTDLPMLSFTLNGELLMNSSIMRIRPANEIYPAVSVTNGSSCEMIFDGDAFAHPPFATKFKMIICSTNLI